MEGEQEEGTTTGRDHGLKWFHVELRGVYKVSGGNVADGIPVSGCSCQRL